MLKDKSSSQMLQHITKFSVLKHIFAGANLVRFRGSNPLGNLMLYN